MARNNATKGAPVGRGGSSAHAGFNPRVESEQPVLIVANNSDLRLFATEMFGYIEASLEAQGGTIPITADEFVSYCATAIKVRVEHVIKTKWRALGHDYTGMTVDEGWALPTPMHDVLSSIGRVRVGTGEISVYPVWDKSADDLVMTKAQRDVVTRWLRSACSTLGISVHDAISKDVEGHHQTMVLVYLPDLAEWWSQQPFAREDAAANAIVGATPVTSVIRGAGGAEYSVVDTSQVATALSQLPMWMPDLRMERQVIVRYLAEMAKIAS